MTQTQRQREAARENIRKAQKRWRKMSRTEHAPAQPHGRDRVRPGMGGSGQFYRIEVRPKSEFVTFRTHDIGEEGHLERLAGKRESGSWDTQAWLVQKDDAHIEKSRLIIDNQRVKKALSTLRGPILHEKGDIFKAQPRRNVPEREKPTHAQRKARRENIKKAQKARRT